MIRARIKLWLEDESGNYLMGPRTAKLLTAIADTGSLKQAAAETDFSYRAAWNRLKRIEKVLGVALVETTVGGLSGGGTMLSQQGQRILERFLQLEQEGEKLLESFAASHSHQVKVE